MKRRSGVAVVADGFDRAAFQGLHAEADFFLSSRLFMDKGIAAFIMSCEESWSCFAAEIAVDALLIDVELARRVFRPFVC